MRERTKFRSIVPSGFRLPGILYAKRQPYEDAMSFCAKNGVHKPAAPKGLGSIPCSRMISSAHANAE